MISPKPILSIKRKLRRRPWILHGLAAFVSLAVLVYLGIEFGLRGIRQSDELEREAYGDSKTSILARELAEASFEEGLAMIDEGDFARGRQVMLRLAPLVGQGAPARGEPRAHLWMARDFFRGRFDWQFLKAFPRSLLSGEDIQLPEIKQPERRLTSVRRHLEAALELAPSSPEACADKTAFLTALGERELALAELIDCIASEPQTLTPLLFDLVHATHAPGDALKWKEICSVEFATLGRMVTRLRRSDTDSRLSYFIYAHLMGEESVADLSLQVLKQDFGDEADWQIVLRDLEVFGHYHKALNLLKEGGTSSFSQGFESLQQARLLHPQSELLLEAVLGCMEHEPSLKDAFHAASDHDADIALLAWTKGDSGPWLQYSLQRWQEEGELALAALWALRASAKIKSLSIEPLKGFSAKLESSHLPWTYRREAAAIASDHLCQLEAWQEAAFVIGYWEKIGSGKDEDLRRDLRLQCYRGLELFLAEEMLGRVEQGD